MNVYIYKYENFVYKSYFDLYLTNISTSLPWTQWHCLKTVIYIVYPENDKSVQYGTH